MGRNVRKLDDEQVLEIYRFYKLGYYSQSAMARIVGVSRQAIKQILDAKGYSCLSGRPPLTLKKTREGHLNYDEYKKAFTDGRE